MSERKVRRFDVIHETGECVPKSDYDELAKRARALVEDCETKRGVCRLCGGQRWGEDNSGGIVHEDDCSLAALREVLP